MRLASLLTFLVITTHLISQTSPSAPARDSKALQIAQVAVAASGLTSAEKVVDLTEDGMIAYNWANETVEGPVKITEIGTSDIQLSAALSAGTYRWFASGGRGKSEKTAGQTRTIPYHCGISQGALTLPVLRLAQAVADPSYELQYLGTREDDSGTHYVVAMKNVSGRNAGERVAYGLDSAEFVIDSKTYLITQVKDVARSESDMFNTVPRTLTFSDYRLQDAVEVPFSIEENVNGAHTWTLHINSTQLNRGIDRSSIGF